MTEVYADDTRYAKYGLLIAERDGKFGMVDKDGSVAVPFEYDYLGLHDRDNPQLGRVDDGYLFAYKDGKVGIIDVNHRIAVPFRYSPEEIYQFEYPQIRFSVRPVSKMRSNAKLICLDWKNYASARIGHMNGLRLFRCGKMVRTV